jgi:hypothetical protein
MSRLFLFFTLLLSWPATYSGGQAPTPVTSPASATVGLLSADELPKLLPPSVFFHGQTAPLQLRNAAAVRFPDGSVLFASLVDTSGYSTSVRERYQFYLLTEMPLTIGGKPLAAGAYGAGFLEDGTFVVMDVGGHDVLLARTERDDTMQRPRPLQMVMGAKPDDLRLYLGRSFATLSRTGR